MPKKRDDAVLHLENKPFTKKYEFFFPRKKLSEGENLLVTYIRTI